MLTVRSIVPSFNRAFTLSRDIDRLFGEDWSGALAKITWSPAVDLVETDAGYELAIELPGVKPADVAVSFERQTLTVRGTKTTLPKSDADGPRAHAVERVGGEFERTFRFPEHVDAAKVSARQEDGVLHITVPKIAAALPRKIEIASGATGAPAAS
jgi:HSP20 family protein